MAEKRWRRLSFHAGKCHSMWEMGWDAVTHPEALTPSQNCLACSKLALLRGYSRDGDHWNSNVPSPWLFSISPLPDGNVSAGSGCAQVTFHRGHAHIPSLGLSWLILGCKAPRGDKGPFALIPRVILPADRSWYLPSPWECRRVRQGAASSNSCCREALPERWNVPAPSALGFTPHMSCPPASHVQGKLLCREWKCSGPSAAAAMSRSDAFP